MRILTSYNFTQNEIQNCLLHPLASAPATAKAGQVYFNTSSQLLNVYNGTAWAPVGIVYDQANSDSAVITGLGKDGSATTTQVISLKLEGYAPVEGGVVTAAMTLEDAIYVLDEALKSAVAGGLTSVTAADKSINVDLTNPNVPSLKANISAGEGNALTLEEDGLMVTIPAQAEYTVSKKAQADEGYIASYQLMKDGAQVGDTINIPKDYLVKSASVEEVAQAGVPYAGAQVGDKYIDFVVNTYDTEAGSGTESHIYLPVNDLVDVYTAGNGIEISAGNVVTAKVVAANGLSVDADGIKMAMASADAAGAMSAAHFSKLEGIAEGAEVNYVKSVAGPLAVDGAGQLSIPASSAATAGTMSVAQFNKLDGIAAGAEVNYVKSVAAPFAVSAAGELSATEASTTAAGLMSAADKAKLEGVAVGATNNTITLNGAVEANPSFFAPVAAGTAGQHLVSGGAGQAPVWADVPVTIKKYTAQNGALTAAGGAFTWTIPAATSGMTDAVYSVQLFEAANGQMVMADVAIDAASFGCTITINDSTGAGSLAAGTYKVVMIG